MREDLVSELSIEYSNSTYSENSPAAGASIVWTNRSSVWEYSVPTQQAGSVNIHLSIRREILILITR